MKTAVVSSQVVKVERESHQVQQDLLAVEEPLEIRLGYGSVDSREQISLAVTMRTPGNDFELAIGFLFSEGIIEGYHDIENIHYCERVNHDEEKENVVRVELKDYVLLDQKRLSRNFYVSSSCGVCGKSTIEALRNIAPLKISANIQIERHTIESLPETISGHQTVFEHTGGLHAVALFDQHGNIIFTCEDVGRHNAFDKVIGKILISDKRATFSNSIVLLSGRASFELVQKAARAGIPVIVAVGAPSSLAVTLAREFQITLIGFLRNNKFNIYSGEERILLTEQWTKRN